jgi:predicted nucleotidyltransferase component of viral defense system
MDFSREFSLAAHVVEKDYVLGWLLAGIFHHPKIGNSWIFIGGTCLKKCFFETYRFSEDLDFTLTNPDRLEQSFLITYLKEVSMWVYDAVGIEIPQDLIRFDVYRNHRIRLFKRCTIRIPTVPMKVSASQVIALRKYLPKKIRALAERQRPRDLYDVVHLFRHDELCPDQSLVLDALIKNADLKTSMFPAWQLSLIVPNERNWKRNGRTCWLINCPPYPCLNSFGRRCPK